MPEEKQAYRIHEVDQTTRPHCTVAQEELADQLLLLQSSADLIRFLRDPAVVVTMATMRMVEMPGNKIVSVVAMRHCFMLTPRAMLVSRHVPVTTVVRRASLRDCARYRGGVFVIVPAAFMVEVPVVQVVCMVPALYGRIPALRSVLVMVTAVRVMVVVLVIVLQAEEFLQLLNQRRLSFACPDTGM